MGAGAVRLYRPLVALRLLEHGGTPYSHTSAISTTPHQASPFGRGGTRSVTERANNGTAHRSFPTIQQQAWYETVGTTDGRPCNSAPTLCVRCPPLPKGGMTGNSRDRGDNFPAFGRMWASAPTTPHRGGIEPVGGDAHIAPFSRDVASDIPYAQGRCEIVGDGFPVPRARKPRPYGRTMRLVRDRRDRPPGRPTPPQAAKGEIGSKTQKSSL